MDNLSFGNGLWESIYHKDLKLAIFDLDGTLYDLQKVRKKVLKMLFLHYLVRPWRFWDLYIIWQFRRQREKLVEAENYDLEETVLDRTAAKTRASKKYIYRLCMEWLINKPLPYLKGFLYPEVETVFQKLHDHQVQIAVYSDFPATEKLRALGLQANLTISSSDPIINRLKPDPKGLNHILSHFQVPPSQTVYIGDLEEKDGACARACKVRFVKVPEAFASM